MSREAWHDLSVQISRQRPRCVLDPLLCLSRRGVALIRRLAPRAELWLAPAFLAILDGWEFYYEQPELLTQSLPMQEHGGAYDQEEFREALHAWIKLREDLGRGQGQLFWAGDNLHESSLASDVEGSVLQHWERLAQGLELRLPKGLHGGPLAAAFLDTVAFAAALDRTVLLTLREPHKPTGLRRAPRLEPTLCHNLGLWGLPCRRLRVEDDFVQYERVLLVRLFVEAGLASFLWSGLPLAVAHFFVPGFVGGDGEPDLLREREPRPVKGVWEDARVFWYFLSVEDEDAAP
jgi:hypothetical protein